MLNKFQTKKDIHIIPACVLDFSVVMSLFKEKWSNCSHLRGKKWTFGNCGTFVGKRS